MHRRFTQYVIGGAAVLALSLGAASVAWSQAAPAHVQLTRDEDFARTRALLGLSGSRRLVQHFAIDTAPGAGTILRGRGGRGCPFRRGAVYFLLFPHATRLLSGNGRASDAVPPDRPD